MQTNNYALSTFIVQLVRFAQSCRIVKCFLFLGKIKKVLLVPTMQLSTFNLSWVPLTPFICPYLYLPFWSGRRKEAIHHVDSTAFQSSWWFYQVGTLVSCPRTSWNLRRFSPFARLRAKDLKNDDAVREMQKFWGYYSTHLLDLMGLHTISGSINIVSTANTHPFPLSLYRCYRRHLHRGKNPYFYKKKSYFKISFFG